LASFLVPLKVEKWKFVDWTRGMRKFQGTPSTTGPQKKWKGIYTQIRGLIPSEVKDWICCIRSRVD